MNFLLSAFLSEGSGEKQTGSFIATYVREKNIHLYPESVQQGIQMNKAFNQFKKLHPAFISSKNMLNPRFIKYGDDIVDVFYDHLLAVEWNSYSGESFKSFVNALYQHLIEFHSILPYKANKLIPVMIRENLLGKIDSLEGLHSYMQVLTRKDNFQSSFEATLLDLMGNYTLFREDFRQCLPDLIEFVRVREEAFGEKKQMLRSA